MNCFEKKLMCICLARSISPRDAFWFRGPNYSWPDLPNSRTLYKGCPMEVWSAADHERRGCGSCGRHSPSARSHEREIHRCSRAIALEKTGRKTFFLFFAFEQRLKSAINANMKSSRTHQSQEN